MDSPQVPGVVQQATQPTGQQEDFLSKYFLWIALGLGAIYYFKILEPLQIAGIIGAIILYYVFIKATKRTHPTLEYKPINLTEEIPKVIKKTNLLLRSNGITLHHIEKTEGYPDYSETGEWPKVQYYLFTGQYRNQNNTTVLVKQGVISREIIKIVPDWTVPDRTKFAWTGESKYPFIAAQPTKMYEPTKTHIEIVTPERSKDEEKDEEANGK